MGSPRESLAIAAHFRTQQIQFMTTLAIVNAIIHIGNSIAATVSGGSSGNADGLKKTMEALKDLLLPDDVAQKESQAQRALKILTEESTKGPLKVRSMRSTKRSRGRITRRRSKHDGSGPTES